MQAMGTRIIRRAIIGRRIAAIFWLWVRPDDCEGGRALGWVVAEGMAMIMVDGVRSGLTGASGS